MRWPDIFFGAGKRREQKAASKSPSETATKLASTVIPTTAIKPASAVSDAPPVSASSDKSHLSPPAARADRPVLLSTAPTVTPLTTEEDPMKAFARANSIRLAKKADQAMSSSEPMPPVTLDPAIPLSTPVEPPAKANTSPALDSLAPPVSESSPAPASITPPARRMAKLTDLARIVSPSEPTEPEPTPEPPSAVSPPAFTVAVPIGNVSQPGTPAAVSSSPTDKPDGKPSGSIEAQVPAGAVAATILPEIKIDGSSSEKSEKTTSPSGPEPIPSTSGQTPKSEAPSSVPFEHLPAKALEKKEFLLINGERILGNILSETPDTIYLDHGTLGVLTLPRSQIAARPVEIILINGDRIVGDIMAETPENLYVRHASLGMLTVPRAQRSARVVEAILKDGDRILGEVLAETENFTVIRSATLGTVPVPHDRIAMLNRKLEQITLKALSDAAPALEDKPKASSSLL